MTLHLKATETWAVGSDANLAQANANRSSSLVESADITKHGGGEYLIPNNTVDQAINFGPVTTAYALRIESNQPILAKINGSSTAIPIGRDAGTKAVLQISQSAGITSLSITNNSGKDAQVYVSLPGV